LSRQPLAGLRQVFLINGAPVKTGQVRFPAVQEIESEKIWQAVIRVPVTELRKGENLISVFSPVRMPDEPGQNPPPSEISVAAPLILISEAENN